MHPAHTAASVRALLPRLHYFEEGTCIVHHLFGGEVTELVRWVGSPPRWAGGWVGGWAGGWVGGRTSVGACGHTPDTPPPPPAPTLPPTPHTRREAYRDAYLTAHFEVPGEMFSLAMDARRSRGMGVVGSTQNILDFIAAK